MATIKVINADQLDADMHSVADAIRERAGTSDAMAWPEGFEESVRGIVDYMAQKITGQLTHYSNHDVTVIGDQGLRWFASLKTVDLPNVATVMQWSCAQSGLTHIVLPKATDIRWDALRECSSLIYADLWVPNKIATRTFYNSSNFRALIIRKDTLINIDATDAFTGTKIAGGTGYIYVRRSLVDSYKTATNWSNYANQIRTLEDYTVDGTITGAIDESKI